MLPEFTAKGDLPDMDIFMVMDDSFDVSELRGEAAVAFDHASAQTYYGASVFWLRWLAALEQDAIEYWQVTRDGGQRGIVRIILEIQ